MSSVWYSLSEIKDCVVSDCGIPSEWLEGMSGDMIDVVKKRTLAGRCLLRKMLCALGFGLEYQMRYSDNGKPFLQGGPSFSISHSANMVAVAVCPTANIGIDIEFENSLSLTDWQSVFSEDLWARSNLNNGSEMVSFWVMMEAYGKATGKGLGIFDDGPINLSKFDQMKMEGTFYNLPDFERVCGAIYVSGKSKDWSIEKITNIW